MLLLTIIYNNVKKELLNDIYNLKRYFDENKRNIGISESYENGMGTIKIFSGDNNIDYNDKNIIDIYVANCVYKIVAYEFYIKEVDKLIYDNYFFLNKEEIPKVKVEIYDTLIEECKINEDAIFYVNRKNDIKKKITDFLKDSDMLNIDGFLTFRMKEVKKIFLEMIDKIIEKHMVEKEYDEFIKLLKYFVEVQETNIDVVHLIITSEGNYKVLNNKHENIMEDLIDSITESKEKDNISISDMIMSGLVTNSPKKIIIHGENNEKNKEFINTIKNVFEDRVVFCDGCKLCNSKPNIKHY